MKVWKTAAVVLAVMQGAQAAEVSPTQFYRSGSTIQCGKPRAEGTDPTRATYAACLRAGVIAIGDELKTIEAQLGQPVEPPREITGRELRLYSYDREKSGSFIVVGYEAGRAATIQVVGPQPAGKHAFAGLEIGDPIASVLSKLGNPSYQRCNLNIHQEVWSYESFPIYLNMSEGVLVGYRLAAAPEFEGPFEPLKRLEVIPC